MKRNLPYLLFVAIVVTGLTVTMLWERDKSSVQIESAPRLSEPNDSGVSELFEEDLTPDSASTGNEECLNPSQLHTDPIIIAEYDRLNAVADKGPYFERYRGLDVATLTGLADAGDSAAMVLLGVHAELRARETSEIYAFDLVTQNERLFSYLGRKLSDDSRAALLEAAEWYYQAALHGRVMALHRYGNTLGAAKGGAVGLGWIGENEFESLDQRERNFLYPTNTYITVTFELVPEIMSGPFEEYRHLFSKGSERSWPIIDTLMDQFLGDLEAAGLPLVSVEVSSLPSADYINDVLCPGYDWRQVLGQ